MKFLIHSILEKFFQKLSVWNHFLFYTENKNLTTTKYRPSKKVSQICYYCGINFKLGSNFGKTEVRKLTPLYLKVRNDKISLYPQAHEVKGYIKSQTTDSDLSCPFCFKKFSSAMSLKTLDVIVVLFY